MASICRICATLKKIENFVHLMDKELDLCNKLEKCCQIIIPENDSLPQNVCQECVSGLNECWKFSENARDAQETLQKLFCPESDSQSNNDKNLRKKLSQNQRQTNKSASPTVEVKNEAPETKTAPTFKHNVEHFTPDIDLEEVEDVSAGFQEERLEDDGATGDDDQNDDVVSSEDESQTQMLISAEILNDTAEVGEIEEREDFEDNQAQETKDRICKVQSNPSQDSGEPQTWSTYPWECRDCSIRLPSSIHLREHALAEHSEGNDMKYYCVDCTKTFSKYYTFINHVKTRHRQSLMNCCDICSTFCEDVESLVVHRATHNDQEHLHLCVICGKGFKKAVGLQLHMNCHQPDSVKYKWECEDCGKKFGTRPNLRAHQKIHLGLKEFVCDQCGKSFVQKANLEEHLLTHVNDKLIECPECGKTFKTPARLAKHKSVHSDIKPYSCEECGRAFRERDTLKVHQRIHTGVMPFECEYCGKKFRFRSILSTHRHQHTGVRPYSCKDCNHHFTNWPNYNKHMKRVHNINTSRKSKPVEKNDARQSQSKSDYRPYAEKIPRIDKQTEQFNSKRVVGTSKRIPRKNFHPIGNDAVVYTCDFTEIDDFNGENHEISIEMEIQDEANEII